MKKMIAMLMSVALVAALAVPTLAAEPFYANEDTSPYDDCQGNRSCPMWYFSDLAGNTWYHDGVHYCLDRMLIVGRTGPEDSTFDPNGSVTRDDLVRTLYRSAIEFGADVSAGQDTNILSYTDAFDIQQGSFEAFQWACASGLVGGETPVLEPNAELTRAELVMVMYNFVKWLQMDVSVGEETNILSYDDAFDIPESAFEAFQWACGAGVIHGVSQRELAPNSGTTRAQLATVLMRIDGLRPAQNVPEDGQRFDPLGAHFAGQWVNEYSSRCVLQIIGNGVGPFKVIVYWSNSAFSFSQWEMTAVHEITENGDSRLVAQDCVRYDVTYQSETAFTYEAVEIGAMQFDYANVGGKETIRWPYELEVADECVFIRENDQVLHPVQSVLEMENSN